jgi:hypothetical protein
MSSELIDPKGPGVLNLSFILYIFKALVVLFFLGALLNIPFRVHEKRGDLQSDISVAHVDIAELDQNINICDNSTQKKIASSSNCTDARAQRKIETAKVAAYKKDLGEFKNQYYALCVWIPGFVAACLMLIGRYVGSASLVAFINEALITLVPGLNAVAYTNNFHFGFIFIFILLAFLGHRYSLYLVPDEATEKTKEPPSDE